MKKPIPYALLAAIFMLGLATEGRAALTLTSANAEKMGINGIGNDFSNQIAASLGTTAGDVDIYSGGIQATSAGTVSFYVLASESGFRNGFLIGANPASPSTSWWESAAGSGSDVGWGGSTLIGSLAVAQGQSLDSLIWFATEGGTSPNFVPAGNFTLPSSQFGMFLQHGTAGSTFETLLFGFDDNGANLDDNHDDLIVKAVFEASPLMAEVPEPTSLVVWGLLVSSAALGTIVRHRRRTA